MADIKLPTRIDMEEKYGASQKIPQLQSPDKKPITPVTIKPVTRKKRSLSQRFADAFLGENITDVKHYILSVAVIPTAKRMICDLLRDIPQLIFFKTTYSGGYYQNQPWNNPNQMPYNKISLGNIQPKTNMYGQPTQQTQNYMFDDIILSSYAEAEAMRDQMLDRIDLYGYVTVAEVNGMMRVPSANATDWNYGWRNLSSCEIRQVRGGWMLMLPRCTYLK